MKDKAKAKTLEDLERRLREGWAQDLVRLERLGKVRSGTPSRVAQG